jgi:dolichyl-phosphate beta-glucosyltransferase
MTQAHVAWVVPCYEEAARLDRAGFLALADGSEPASLILVDDGSRDATLAMLRALAEERPGRIEILALPENRGKAEAVRTGMRHALAGGAGLVGYVDADLATPPAELVRLANLMRAADLDLLLGSRVQLLGREIKRSTVRHYFGRIFATCASLSLGLPVYDTQCGAKLFRPTPALAAALERAFVSRWAFDVELLGRLVRPGPAVAPITADRIREEPLSTWVDVPGSKLGMAGALRAGLDLLRVGLKSRLG